ncbi:glycosyl-4,4'-diaponeurosporenoate acyltransferase CrtO family protein [Hymenobacter cellulosilyticus]|uniref:Glycosyl-4,4'-diaponeurosporenoate acyltransferase n=1 Tax=Hymenobacter cellulosilyticus TaxID=2932248 RepID=A0A8T9QEF6_9BACT|nr:hypothetical protein [Hymenobacter cellulosilyticus]UOQ73203.1 hypothetical protein MUN79_04320 [Hymenobacter cellulosilyticus]
MLTEKKASAPSAAFLTSLNAVPNVLWSGLSLGPLSAFCYQHMARPWLWGLLAASLLVYAVPKTWFRYWQLSRSRVPYQRLGVPAVNYFTQHGYLVNFLIRRRYPHYRHAAGPAALRRLASGSYHQERFHASMLLFFAGTSVYAAAQGHLGWAVVLLLSNVGYNLYPIWLQQYLRLRVAQHSGASSSFRSQKPR